MFVFEPSPGHLQLQLRRLQFLHFRGPRSGALWWNSLDEAMNPSLELFYEEDIHKHIIKLQMFVFEPSLGHLQLQHRRLQFLHFRGPRSSAL